MATDYTNACKQRNGNHTCAESATIEFHVHKCVPICGAKWVSKHTYVLDTFSDCNNCKCGRPEGDKIHAEARSH
jgi:hypothetical protein